ncbi:MAG: dihydrofolate reductase family protein [Bacteroidota bacterium]
MSQRKVILYISMSLDGFIATKEDDISWLSCVDKKGEDYGYEAFTETVDAYIIGRTTYEVVLGLCGGQLPQAERFDCYVITRQEREPENGVTFYNGDIEELIYKLKQEEGKNIYCDGGGQIVQLLMQKNLIDEYIVSIIPILLGDGKRLFLGQTQQISLQALPSKQYDTGLVQLRYLKQ